MKRIRACIRLLLLAAALAVWAAAGAQEVSDPPGRVGRVGEFAGTLHLAPEDTPDDWGVVGRNYPVTGGDNLWVTPDGHAEIDFGSGLFRLAGDANVYLARLDDREFSLFVANGRVIVRLRFLEEGETASVTTPNATVTFRRPGVYRVDVDAGPTTTLIVRDGEADFATAQGVEPVGPDRLATVTGENAEQLGFYGAPGYDGFDSWSASRDERIDRSVAADYVSPGMIGAYELDQYGGWDRHPEYGSVWYPATVADDWAPYRFGRWVWLDPWGWTWVDDAPWGFAPFHYGRWVHVAGRWGWAPGPYIRRPIWSPALVAWYGGSGWSVGVGVGGGPVYGWVPLGWRDPYWPRHRVSNARWRSLNRPYAVNLAERRDAPPTRYSNYRVPGAVTAVPGAVFQGQRPVPVSPNRVRVPPGSFARAPAVNAPPVLLKPRRTETEVRRTVPVPPAASAIGGVRGTITAVPPSSRPAPRSSDRSAGPAVRPLPADRGSAPSVRPSPADRGSAPSVRPAPVPRSVPTSPSTTAPRAAPASVPRAAPAPRVAPTPAPRAAPTLSPAPIPRAAPAPAQVRPSPPAVSASPARAPLSAPPAVRDQGRPGPAGPAAQPMQRSTPAPVPRAEPRAAPPARRPAPGGGPDDGEHPQPGSVIKR